MKSHLSSRLGLLAALVLGVVLCSALLTTTSDPAAAQDGPPDVTQRGDVNCSGTTNIIDALFIMLYVIDLRVGVDSCPIDTRTEINITHADFDNDGVITIVDALVIARCDAGIELPACAPDTEPENLAVNDQMVDAIEIFPSQSGFEIGEVETNVIATGEPDENRDNCFRADPSVWYKFEATNSRVSFVPSNDDQWAGIYRANEGVTHPTQMSDLTLISCNDVSRDVGAIVRPGETYWVSVSDAWRQKFWAFDRGPGCPSGDVARCGQRDSNDLAKQAVGIDLGSGTPILVDDFSPGFNDYTSSPITWSYENRVELVQLGCSDTFPSSEDTLNDPSTGSIWYQVVGTGDALEVVGGENQQISIFEPREPYVHLGVSNIRGIEELKPLGCGTASSKPTVFTTAGQTYFIAAWGHNPGEPFTITAGAEPTQASNDQMINATEIFPNSDGFSIGEISQHVTATTEPDENRGNCMTERFGEGTVWYKFEATTGRVSFFPSDNEQFIGIFRPSEGVSVPTQMSDLELISCGESDSDVGAIVRPGETYWVGVSSAWRQRLWVFDRDSGCPAEFVRPCEQRRSNDELRQSIGIDVRNGGVATDVDDFDPGASTEASSAITWSYSPDEVGALGCGAAANVSSLDFQGASFWYQVVAPSELLEINGSDDQYVGIYERNEPLLPGPNRLSDLTQLACGQPQFRPVAATVPGETYYIVSWEEHPGQVFSVRAGGRAINDDITGAIEIAATPAGTFISADQSGGQATLAPNEDATNCHDDSGPDSEGSVWYRFTPTQARVSVVGGENANTLVGIYALASGIANPTTISDLEVISCSRLNGGTSAILVAGATYWVSVGKASEPFWLFDGAPQCAQTLDLATPCPVRSNNFVDKATGIDTTYTGGRFVDDFTWGDNRPGTYGMEVTFDDSELAEMELEDSCFTSSDDYETGSIWYRLVAPGDSLTTEHIDQQTIAFYELATPENHSAAESVVPDLNELRRVGCSLEPFGTPSSIATTPGATYYLAVSGPVPGQTFGVNWPE